MFEQRSFSIFLALACVAISPMMAEAQSGGEHLSPTSIAIAPGGGAVYVAEHTGRQVAVLDVGAKAVSRVMATEEAPTGLALTPDGSKVCVTAGVAEGKVYVFEAGTGTLVATLAAGHSPCAPVISPDGARLYVCNKFNDNVSIFELGSGKELGKAAVLRQPTAAALTPDGRFLVVANLLPSGAADGDYTAAAVSIVDTGTRQTVGNAALPNGSMSLHGVCVSGDGQFAYVTHILARYLLPTTQLERGWMNTNAMSIIDIAQQTRVNTVLLDSVDLGAANPWGIVCSPDGQWILATHAGTHEVSVINRALLHERLGKAAAGERVTEVSSTAEDVPNDLSFMVGIQRRVGLGGNGPRAIAMSGNTAYVAEYFSDSVSVVELGNPERPLVSSIALGGAPSPSSVRLGEQLFHDASLCFQKWQSCASCHPDARVDGLNWDLLNDGLGNPKNTKSMLLSHQTPPAMSLGVRDTAETAVRSGIKFIQFVVRPESDAAAIDEYLKALEPVPSPHLEQGALNAAAQRGAAIYEQAGCAVCHPAPLYTNLQNVDVGTGTALDADKGFDTPTLIEAWRTAPYLHDGRAVTMKDALGTHNNGDKHGVTSTLTPEQLDDLVAFVLSL